MYLALKYFEYSHNQNNGNILILFEKFSPDVEDLEAGADHQGMFILNILYFTLTNSDAYQIRVDSKEYDSSVFILSELVNLIRCRT